MPEWHFTLVLSRGMSEEEADRFDTLDGPLFADGSLSYTMGGPGPSTLVCAIEAPTLLEAAAEAASAVRRIPGLRAVAAEQDDLLTLAEAAERLRGVRTLEELTTLAQERAGDGEFPAAEGETDAVSFYSWTKLAAWLRALGDDVPDTDHDLQLADRALRVAHELDTAGVPDSVRRGLGLVGGS
ncbi:hypothetical protein [Streptomyces specialis]|uniref:hypothetical protein n=1 Tax=Streptomyces specialis TaxID=498367 RepID=UPI00073FA3E8|nr:hypothetical protein [Streptomyces specialis]